MINSQRIPIRDVIEPAPQYPNDFVKNELFSTR